MNKWQAWVNVKWKPGSGDGIPRQAIGGLAIIAQAADWRGGLFCSFSLSAGRREDLARQLLKF